MNSKSQNDPQPESSINTSVNQQPIYYMPAQMPAEDDEINLLDYWRILMRYKWLIVLITFISGAGTIVYAFSLTPIYRAEITLAPAAEDKGAASALSGQFGGLASLAGINMGGGGGKTEEALATLNSRLFTDAFIKDNHLMPVLFSSIWDENSKSWMLESDKDKPTAWKAYKAFNDIRTISDDKKTGMIILAIEWEDPELATLWANQLIERINIYQKNKAIKEAQRSIEYLQNELKTTSVVEMRQAIYRLIESQTKNIMLANVRDEYVFKIIDPAQVPEEKLKPKKKLMAILGTIVGFMLGVFLAFLLAFIKKQKEQITETAIN